jgi:hypothetical protein
MGSMLINIKLIPSTPSLCNNTMLKVTSYDKEIIVRIYNSLVLWLTLKFQYQPLPDFDLTICSILQ